MAQSFPKLVLKKGCSTEKAVQGKQNNFKMQLIQEKARKKLKRNT